MNRRGFLGVCMGAAASVAIGMRVARGMPEAFINDRMKSEHVGDFTYFMDLDHPEDVSIYFKQDVKGTHPVTVETINKAAEVEHKTLHRFPLRSGDSDEIKSWKHHRVNTQYEPIDITTPCLELCAIIGMSQGMAGYFNDNRRIAVHGVSSMNYAEVPLAQIAT